MQIRNNLQILRKFYLMLPKYLHLTRSWSFLKGDRVHMRSYLLLLVGCGMIW